MRNRQNKSILRNSLLAAAINLFLAPQSLASSLLSNMPNILSDINTLNTYYDNRRNDDDDDRRPSSSISTQGNSNSGSGSRRTYSLVQTSNNTNSATGGSATLGSGLVLEYPSDLRANSRLNRCSATTFRDSLFPVYGAGTPRAMPINSRTDIFELDLPSGGDLAAHTVDCSSYITRQPAAVDGGTNYQIEGSSSFVCYGGSWVAANSSCVAVVVPAPPPPPPAPRSTAAALCGGTAEPGLCYGPPGTAYAPQANGPCCCYGTSWQLCTASGGPDPACTGASGQNLCLSGDGE